MLAEKEIIIDGKRFISIESDESCLKCAFNDHKNLCDIAECLDHEDLLGHDDRIWIEVDPQQ